jgi:hypothetical protein
MREENKLGILERIPRENFNSWPVCVVGTQRDYRLGEGGAASVEQKSTKPCFRPDFVVDKNVQNVFNSTIQFN